MSLQALLAFRLVYVATPYTKYHLGIDKAWEHACAVSGALIEQGIKIFSPIAHSHAICKFGGVEPLDHGIWLEIDGPMMDAADAIVIVKLDGFDDSYGVDYEKDVFLAADKPIFYLDPNTMELSQ